MKEYSLNDLKKFAGALNDTKEPVYIGIEGEGFNFKCSVSSESILVEMDKCYRDFLIEINDANIEDCIRLNFFSKMELIETDCLSFKFINEKTNTFYCFDIY